MAFKGLTPPAQGEWRSGLNGGDKSGDSWLSNPQYFFQLSQPARVVAIISSAVKGNFGVYIVKATGACPAGLFVHLWRIPANRQRVAYLL